MVSLGFKAIKNDFSFLRKPYILYWVLTNQVFAETHIFILKLHKIPATTFIAEAYRINFSN